MKRHLITGTVAVLALAAGACSSTNTTALPSPHNTSEASDTNLPTAEVGDTLATECMSTNPCSASFTITDITASDTCVGRFDNYGDGIDQLDEGKMYVSMAGEFEVDYSNNGWTMMHDPKFIDGEGFTITGSSGFCHSDEPYSSWSTTVDEGQKARVFGAWIVPDDATHLLLMDHQIDIPEVEDAAPSPEPTVPATSAEVPAPPTPKDAPASEPTVEAPAASPPVGFTGAPNGAPQPLEGKTIDYCFEDMTMYEPGTTMFTDGTTGFTLECANG